jgi:acyl-CoA synthetase (AMP-forming)/AMP-acid ligase II
MFLLINFRRDGKVAAMADFGDLLAGILALDASAPAVEVDGGTWWSWGDLDKVVRSILATFDRLEVPEGGRIGIFFRNRPEHLAALVACAVGGRCAVAMNPMMPADRLAADVRSLDLALLFGDQRDLVSTGLVDAAREEGVGCWLLPATPGELIPVEGASEPRDVAARRTSPGVLIEMLTSGTTGTPKRVPLLRSTFQTSFDAATVSYEKNRAPDEPLKLRTGVRILTAPLSHISGISAALMTLGAGRKLALFDKFKVEEWVEAIGRHRTKVANAPPAALRMVLDANVPREKLASLSALRTGTAPLDPVIADEFLERYDIPVLQTYGATEFAGAVAGWSLEDFRALYREKRGSVGRLQKNVEGRVVDPETGVEKAPGEEGVLELRGKQLDRSDWLRTTDRAVLDADGFLFIRGRADNAINRGGFKVHADDVVKVLESHPAIREASVVGIPDRRLGEVPVAAIILVAGASAPDEAELASFARERLVAYQVPTRFIIVDELPRTPSMKPSLPAVKALFASEAA